MLVETRRTEVQLAGVDEEEKWESFMLGVVRKTACVCASVQNLEQRWGLSLMCVQVSCI